MTMKTIKILFILIFIIGVLVNCENNHKYKSNNFEKDSLRINYDILKTKNIFFDYQMLSHYYFKCDSFQITLIEGYNKKMNYISIHLFEIINL